MEYRSGAESIGEMIASTTSKDWAQDAAHSIWHMNCFPLHESSQSSIREVNDGLLIGNGDRFSLTEQGWSLRDRHGNSIVKLSQIDHAEMPGNSVFLLSNGARYNSGCFSDSITYPNGDSVSWTRNGKILSSHVAGDAMRTAGQAAQELGRTVGKLDCTGFFPPSVRKDAADTLGAKAAEIAARSVAGGMLLNRDLPDMGRRTAEIAASGILGALRQSDRSPHSVSPLSRNPYEPVLEDHKQARDIALRNGDHFKVSADGQIRWTDARGHAITQVRRIDNGSIPGNTSYEMSNGARYDSGCFSDSISYKNGDTITFSRNGSVVTGVVGGRRVN